MSTLLVLEGQDGCGKTTTAKALTARLLELGLSAVYMREPGSTPVGEALREMALGHGRLTDTTVFYLFQAARLEMLEDIRLHHLKTDYIVLDRFWPSTLAYQVYGMGLPHRLYEAAQDRVMEAVSKVGSEIDICLTLPDEIRQQRLREAGKGHDRLESKPLDFTLRVQQAYEDMVAKCMLHPVDASADVKTVVEFIIENFVSH